jgi:hypothetical protein
MMSTVKYRLPVSWLVVTGTVRTTTDELDPGLAASASLIGVEYNVVTTGDSSQELTLTPPKGLFMTCKSTFGVGRDDRLMTVTSEVTGEGGAALKSIASLAGTAAAIVLLDTDKRPLDDAENATILGAYKGVYPEQHAVLRDLRTAKSQLLHEIRQQLQHPDSADLASVQRLRALLAIVDEQLSLVDVHFRTWRSSKRTTVDQYFELRVAIDEIPEQLDENGGGSSPGSAPPTTVLDLWQRFGSSVYAIWVDPPIDATGVGSSNNTVYSRRPRVLELRFVTRVGGKQILTDSRRLSVASAKSRVDAYKLEKSWLGRKSLLLTFDSDGFVASASTEGSSNLAAGLAAAESLPSAFTSGLETGTKLYSDAQAARRASLEAELARVKERMDLQSQQLLAAKASVTAADAVRLERLQQLQAILDAQAKITAVDPALVTELTKQAADDPAWYPPPVSAGSPEPQVIRLVVEGGSTVTPAEQSTTPRPAPPPPTLLGH